MTRHLIAAQCQEAAAVSLGFQTCSSIRKPGGVLKTDIFNLFFALPCVFWFPDKLLLGLSARPALSLDPSGRGGPPFPDGTLMRGRGSALWPIPCGSSLEVAGPRSVWGHTSLQHTSRGSTKMMPGNLGRLGHGPQELPLGVRG